MNITTMTAREARAIANPRQDLLNAAVEHIVSLGWQWRVSDVCPPHVKNPYSWGWWFNPNDERKPRPAGDPGNFHLKAWDTFKIYVAPGR